MAVGATVYHFQITLSDVDRAVYESLDLRIARHPSETMRYLLTRTIAYCLSFEPGIAFSKGGLSTNDEPPIAIRDPTGILRAWIEIGAPSAERLHKASKAAGRVAVFTHVDLAMLRREASSRAIHKLDAIEIWQLTTGFLDALDAQIDRHAKLELVRTDGRLYVTLGGRVTEGSIERASLST